MDPLNLKKYSPYFFFGSFILVIVLSLILVRSYLITVLGAVILAYIFNPIYKKLVGVLKNKTVCAILVSIIIIIILIVPIMFAANAIIGESFDLFTKVRNLNTEVIDKYIGEYIGNNIDIGAYTKDLLNKLSIYLMQITEAFIWSLPEKVLSLFVMFFVLFYSLKDGKKLVEAIKDEVPLTEKHKENLYKRFNGMIYATLYGTIVTSVIAGVLGALGFYFFGISSPTLWGIIMGILSMLPAVGASLVWLPMGIYQVAMGNTFAGIGVMAYGWVIVSSMENIVRPKIIGVKGKTHPVLVLLGVLGGLQVFGLVGIIIGPLILSILALFFELYLSDKYEAKG